ncbi:transporter substrate-binding domain-containing protein [Mycoplasma sp. P36-A1]|uniref:transporter substrate-binding domain-containing protein n=1 Tax=Mycoplasma sp. P36-A1 TaxID=3252900 RepID=UPI003C2AB812
MKKQHLSIIFALIITFVLVGCSSKKDDNNSNTTTKVLTVGLECDYAPYNWTTTKAKKTDNAIAIEGSKGYCEGYDMWMARQISKITGYEIKVKKMSFDGLIPALQSHDIDAIIAGMSPTDERKNTIAFSKVYFRENITMGLVVKKDSKYAKGSELSDFKGANLSAQQGTTQVNLLSQINPDSKAVALPDYNALVQATKSGSIDGYLGELQVAQQHVAANSDLTLVDLTNKFKLTEAESTVAIGLRKDDTKLLDTINNALAQIPDDQRIAEMEKIQANIDN